MNKKIKLAIVDIYHKIESIDLNYYEKKGKNYY